MAFIKNAIKNRNQGIEVGYFFQTSVYNPYAKSTKKIQSLLMIIDFFWSDDTNFVLGPNNRNR